MDRPNEQGSLHNLHHTPEQTSNPSAEKMHSDWIRTNLTLPNTTNRDSNHVGPPSPSSISPRTIDQPHQSLPNITTHNQSQQTSDISNQHFQQTHSPTDSRTNTRNPTTETKQTSLSGTNRKRPEGNGHPEQNTCHERNTQHKKPKTGTPNQQTITTVDLIDFPSTSTSHPTIPTDDKPPSPSTTPLVSTNLTSHPSPPHSNPFPKLRIL
jgi:hypothetical protein